MEKKIVRPTKEVQALEQVRVVFENLWNTHSDLSDNRYDEAMQNHADLTQKLVGLENMIVKQEELHKEIMSKIVLIAADDKSQREYQERHEDLYFKKILDGIKVIRDDNDECSKRFFNIIDYVMSTQRTLAAIGIAVAILHIILIYRILILR